MSYSNKSIYEQYGQFDNFLIVEFYFGSEEYVLYGNEIMGTFIYSQDERNELEKLKKEEAILDDERNVKICPSKVENFNKEELFKLEKEGFSTKSIRNIFSLDFRKVNRFAESGKKKLPRHMKIKAPTINSGVEHNKLLFGWLSSMYEKGEIFTPKKEIEYWAVRKHFNIQLDKEDYLEILKRNNDFKNKVRYKELELKIHELSITENEIKEYTKFLKEDRTYKKCIIDLEIQRSSEKIESVSKHYRAELDELRKCCYNFDEEILSFGKIPIYLTFERFVHIYARHVSETQIGERFRIQQNKTVFSYKFDDIRSLIKMIINDSSDEIQKHFKEYPEKDFLRLNKSPIYFDGHYYRVVIDQNGSLRDFHPLNENIEK